MSFQNRIKMTCQMIAVIVFLSIWTSINALTPTRSPGVYQLTDPVDHAECPVWDQRNNVLYYVNIHEGQIFRYDYTTEEVNWITLDGEIAPVLPSKRDPNLLIVGLNRSVVAVEWNGLSEPSQPRILANLATQFPTSRVNEGKADSEGRLWIGTMGFEGPNGLTTDEGLLYLLTCDNVASPAVQIAPVNISNGLAWNAANDKFFYIDTISGQVAGYAYDAATGAISDRTVVFDMSNHSDLAGGPDGMTIDENDNLWVALYGGGSVIHIDSATGELLQRVPIPARDVTSVMFGGPDLDVLFVSTSRISLSEQEQHQQPAAGSVFVVMGLEVKGRPLFEVDLLGTIDDQCGAS